MGAAGCLLAIAVSACSLNEPTSTPGTSLLPDPPHLQLGTVEELFNSAGSYLQSVNDLEVVTFRCTIIEGSFCWFNGAPEDGAIARELSERIIDQVDPNAIENANRNLVLIQCARPLNGNPPLCEIDWGWGAGWEALALD